MSQKMPMTIDQDACKEYTLLFFLCLAVKYLKFYILNDCIHETSCSASYKNRFSYDFSCLGF